LTLCNGDRLGAGGGPRISGLESLVCARLPRGFVPSGDCQPIVSDVPLSLGVAPVTLPRRGHVSVPIRGSGGPTGAGPGRCTIHAGPPARLPRGAGGLRRELVGGPARARTDDRRPPKPTRRHDVARQAARRRGPSEPGRGGDRGARGWQPRRSHARQPRPALGVEDDPHRPPRGTRRTWATGRPAAAELLPRLGQPPHAGRCRALGGQRGAHAESPPPRGLPRWFNDWRATPARHASPWPRAETPSFARAASSTGTPRSSPPPCCWGAGHPASAPVARVLGGETLVRT